MKEFANCIKTFLISDDGPAAVEYAVMLALIVATAVENALS
jgi:Flp pilus assembly pilin Flp